MLVVTQGANRKEGLSPTEIAPELHELLHLIARGMKELY